MKKFLVAAVVVLGFSGILLGDELLLKNGNIIRGKIISEGANDVIMEIPVVGHSKNDSGQQRYIKMSFNRERIRRIQKARSILEADNVSGGKDAGDDLGGLTDELQQPVSPASSAKPVSIDKKKAGDKEEKSSPVAAADKKKEEKEDELDPSLKAQIQRLISGLDNTDAKIRDGKIKRLSAIGADAIPLLAEAFEGAGNLKRMSLIGVLEKIGDKSSVWALIGQLKGGIRDKTRMHKAWVALKKITGKSFYFDKSDSAKKRNSDAQKWMDWLESVKNEYPKQAGVDEKEFYGEDGYQGEEK